MRKSTYFCHCEPAGRSNLRKISILLWLSSLLAFSACAPAPAPTAAPSTPQATASPTATLTLEPSATPEMVVLPPADEAPFSTPTFLSAPPSTQTVEAMQLFFPTVIPVEGAEFRPPIYPVPWALSPHDHFYFTRPISAYYPADPVWDYRYGGVYFGPEIVHTGIDLPAPNGTDVMAAGPGTVVWAGYGLFSGALNNMDDPYGLAITIRHDFGYNNKPLFTVYAHLMEVDVVVGQHVETGEVIGNVGVTGVTTGPHLHFEVRLGENDFWETRNPELWLAPPQGYGVLAGRVMSTYGTILNSYLVMAKSLETGHYYTTWTYAELNVHADEYYQENMAIGNLPAGVYELNIPYGALNRIVNIEILPGQVTYFKFYGFAGYDFGPPVTPTPQP